MFLFHLQQFSVATSEEIFVDNANGLIVLQYISDIQSIFVGFTAMACYIVVLSMQPKLFDKIY